MKFVRELYCWLTRGHSWSGVTKRGTIRARLAFWCRAVRKRGARSAHKGMPVSRKQDAQDPES